MNDCISIKRDQFDDCTLSRFCTTELRPTILYFGYEKNIHCLGSIPNQVYMWWAQYHTWVMFTPKTYKMSALIETSQNKNTVCFRTKNSHNELKSIFLFK